jgi:hypothetical protein
VAQQAEPLAALGDDFEHAELLHVPVGNMRQRAHRVRFGQPYRPAPPPRRATIRQMPKELDSLRQALAMSM